MKTKQEIKEYQKKWYKENQERLKEKYKQQYRNDRQNVLEQQKQYKHGKGKQRVQEYFRNRYHTDENTKIRCFTRSHNEKTGICNDCGKQTTTQFHHLSYNPNIFIEVCIPCHKERHREKLEGTK